MPGKKEGEREPLPAESAGEPGKDKKVSASTVFAAMLFFLTGGYLLFNVLHSMDAVDFSGIEIFNTVFISILMQAFPFMLIGVLVSSAIHVFIPDEAVVKAFPEKYGLGFLTAMLAGVIFPVCECAIVPVTNRLVKKGVAAPIAVTFMLSAPIVNPIVVISTLYAFPGKPRVAVMRVCLGLLIALLTGLILLASGRGRSVLSEKRGGFEECGCAGTCNPCGRAARAQEGGVSRKGTGAKIRALFLHAGEEFFGVGKYLILGAFTTALIQTLVPKEMFVRLGAREGLSLFMMMSAAFLFSACSTSDAFIARSFANRLPLGAVMGFLVFGPMMDVKNILMLFESFRKSFVLKLTALVSVLNFTVLYFFFAFLLS